MPTFVSMVIFLFVQSLLQQVGWFLVGVVVVPILAEVCPFFPSRILVACKMGFVVVGVVVVALFVDFYTWVYSNTHEFHGLCTFS